MSLLINQDNINVKEVKTKIRAAKTVKAKKADLSKKQINIPIPESLRETPTISLLGVTSDGDLIDPNDLYIPPVKVEKRSPEIALINEEPVEVIKKKQRVELPTELVGETVVESVPFYQRGDLQIVGGILAITALGYVIYRYWPSSAASVVVPSAVKGAIKGVVKDSVASTL